MTPECEPVHLYAFDPGETTGWAHMSVIDNEPSLFTGGQVDHVGLGNLLLQNTILEYLHTREWRACSEVLFICESFQMNPKKMAAPWSLEAIGLIRYAAKHYGIPLIFQTPSQAKSLVKDEHLKKLELWVPGQRHRNDAVLHAIYYLIKEKGLLSECLVA